MDFKQLEAFVWVVRLGGFSRAAEKLFLTQPTISAHVGALEREVGARLVVRGGREAVPTEAGEKLYAYAQEMLALRERALEAFGRPERGLSGVVRVAASTVTGRYVLPCLMLGFRRLHGGVSFDIWGCDSGGVARALSAGQADLGMTGAVIPGAGCVFQPFMEDELVVVTPPGPPFDTMARDAFTLGDLRAHPFILREADSGTRRMTEAFLKDRGLSIDDLRVAARMEEPDAIKNAVSQGMGISIISRLAVESYEKLGQVRTFGLMGHPIVRKLYMAWRKGRPQTPAAAAFLDYVRAGIGVRENDGEQ